jgi:hypothetical protein
LPNTFGGGAPVKEAGFLVRDFNRSMGRSARSGLTGGRKARVELQYTSTTAAIRCMTMMSIVVLMVTVAILITSTYLFSNGSVAEKMESLRMDSVAVARLGLEDAAREVEHQLGELARRGRYGYTVHTQGGGDGGGGGGGASTMAVLSMENRSVACLLGASLGVQQLAAPTDLRIVPGIGGVLRQISPSGIEWQPRGLKSITAQPSGGEGTGGEGHENEAIRVTCSSLACFPSGKTIKCDRVTCLAEHGTAANFTVNLTSGECRFGDSAAAASVVYKPGNDMGPQPYAYSSSAYNGVPQDIQTTIGGVEEGGGFEGQVFSFRSNVRVGNGTTNREYKFRVASGVESFFRRSADALAGMMRQWEVRK